MVPEGSEFLVSSRLRGGFTTLPGLMLPDGAKKVVKLERFSIDYRPDGSVGQYRSVLTESDLQVWNAACMRPVCEVDDIKGDMHVAVDVIRFTHRCGTRRWLTPRGAVF